MGTTTSTQIPAATLAFYDRNLLERAEPALIHGKFGQIRDLPSKAGLQIKFRKYNALAAASVPLTEGVTPVGSALSITDSLATPVQYGDFVTLTDIIDMTNPDPVVTEATAVLGEQAGLTIDNSERDVLNAGTTVVYAGEVANDLIDTRVEVASGVAVPELDRTIKMLMGQKAKFFTQLIQGSAKVNTFPIRPAYFGITHTDIIPRLEAMTGWKGVEEYASQQQVDINEFGAYKNVRYLATTEAKVFAGAGAAGANVYTILTFGKDAYGTTKLRGKKSFETIIKALGSGGTSDPLNQRSTVGWKAFVATKILNDAWMVRHEVLDA